MTRGAADPSDRSQARLPGQSPGTAGPGFAFLSYVREDSQRVDQLQQVLEAAGIPVWRDTARLWPGEDWRAKIRQAITDNALVFIACFSQASTSRTKSYQNDEFLVAVDQLRQRRPGTQWLIPVRLDEETRPTGRCFLAPAP